ncbi:sclerostin domain-containing protein 1a [Stigmatopora nigra]
MRQDFLPLLLFMVLGGCQAFKNDATEHTGGPVVRPQPAGEDVQGGNASLNRARAGGRSVGRDGNDRNQLGCRELRSTKYISDGHCTSVHPIKELVCAGECLPSQMLHNWIGDSRRSRRFWTRRAGNPDWRCVNDKTRAQRIRLQCLDGSARTYKITVVTSCKCKRFSRQHNESGQKFGAGVPQQTQSKSGKSLGEKHTSQNWHQIGPLS